jgi:hypothetical protein
MPKEKKEPEQKTLEETPVADPKKRIKRKKATAPKKPVGCWNRCKCLCACDGTDYVHICLGDTFVTKNELERMISSEC